jgi:cytochrome c-type biogenesis protein CcmH
MALAPANIALHAELGEALVLEAQGTVTPATEDEFAKTPDDPRSRYYAAEAALQHDDPAAAKKKLDALLANAPSDAPWRQTVADRLAELSQNVGAAPSARASGPTLRDIAPELDGPQVAQSRICGRVEGLEQLLLRAPEGFRKRRKQLFYRDSEPGAG